VLGISPRRKTACGVRTMLLGRKGNTLLRKILEDTGQGIAKSKIKPREDYLLPNKEMKNILPKERGRDT